MKYMVDKNKGALVRRLKLIEGQVRGLQKMIESDTYCIDIITQTSAVKQGLSNVEDLLLENHLGGCILNQLKLTMVRKRLRLPLILPRPVLMNCLSILSHWVIH